MNQEEPTTLLGLKVWWAFFWRSIILTIPGAFLVSLPVGVVFAILRVDQQYAGIAGGVVGAAVGLYVAAFVVKRLMTKGFGQFRLVVVKK